MDIYWSRGQFPLKERDPTERSNGLMRYLGPCQSKDGKRSSSLPLRKETQGDHDGISLGEERAQRNGQV